MRGIEANWNEEPEIRHMLSFKLPAIDEFHLENNIPLTVVRDGRLEAFRLDIVFKCGQVDQAKLLEANTTCRMLKEGTSHLSSQELAEKFDFYGAWLETATYFLYTRITLYSLTKYADETIPLIASIVRDATFPEHEFDIVNNFNKAYSQVIAAKSNVKAQRALLTSLFGRENICGKFASVADYERLNVDSLQDFYRLFYNSSNCNLFFSGTLTSELRSKIETAFGKYPWGNTGRLPLRKVPPKQLSKEKRVFTECPTACQNSVQMGCFLMPRTDENFLLSSFFNTLLGGFFGSRLMMELRERRGLTYGIGSTVSMYPFDTVLLISSETSCENVDALIAGVYQEIQRLQEELVSDEELSLVKNYYISDLCRTYEEPFSVADYYINMKFFGLPYDSQEKAASRAVRQSAEDIRALACRYLHSVDFRESVSGKSM